MWEKIRNCRDSVTNVFSFAALGVVISADWLRGKAVRFFEGVIGWSLLVFWLILGCSILLVFMLVNILILVWRLLVAPWRLFSAAAKELDETASKIAAKQEAGGCRENGCETCELLGSCLLFERLTSPLDDFGF